MLKLKVGDRVLETYGGKAMPPGTIEKIIGSAYQVRWDGDDDDCPTDFLGFYEQYELSLLQEPNDILKDLL